MRNVLAFTFSSPVTVWEGGGTNTRAVAAETRLMDRQGSSDTPLWLPSGIGSQPSGIPLSRDRMRVPSVGLDPSPYGIEG